MYNEEIREKAVFEDFGFEPSDLDELKRREAETIELIKNGKLPTEEIKGEIQIKLLNFENLTRVQGKPVVYYKLKRTYFNTEQPDQPVVAHRDVKPGFMQKKFSWETNRMDVRINLNDLMSQNLHLQGDTVLIELYMVEAAESQYRKTATFVGEIRFGYKHCFEPDKKNQWHWKQTEITDAENKRKGRKDELLSGQINLEVRYQEQHLIQARQQQNIPKELVKQEQKHDHFEHRVGKAGTLHIVPVMMDFTPESGLTFDAEPTMYGMVFTMDNNPALTTTSEALGQTEGPSTSCNWADTVQLEVNDTNTDKIVNCTLVKLTSVGEQDIPVATAQVPAAKMADIYAQVDVKQKTFTVEMKKDGQAVGSFRLKIMLSSELLKGKAGAAGEEEEKKADEMVPAGSLAAAAASRQ